MRIISTALTLFFIAACAPRFIQPTFVLSEDDGIPFHIDPEDRDVYVYQNPNLKAKSYSKFLINPVKIYSNEPHSIKPEEEKTLTEGFRKEIIDAIQGGYPIVEKSGPGVLRVRAAILDIQPASVQLDEEKFVVLRLDTILAHVSMQLECVDSVSGERVAALMHRLGDEKYLHKNPQARFLNVREAFGEWARSLRARLDRAKARPDGWLDGFDREENKRLRSEEGE